MINHSNRIQEAFLVCKFIMLFHFFYFLISFDILFDQEFQYLWEKLDLVFDGGCLGNNDVSRYGSTVVDLSVPGVYKIIRDGCALSAVEKTLKAKFGLSEVDRT